MAGTIAFRPPGAETEDDQIELEDHAQRLTVNAAVDPHNRRPRAIAHAEVLASVVGFDMAAAGWAPMAEAYLGRVTKARILAAVREARGADAAGELRHQPDTTGPGARTRAAIV